MKLDGSSSPDIIFYRFVFIRDISTQDARYIVPLSLIWLPCLLSTVRRFRIALSFRQFRAIKTCRVVSYEYSDIYFGSLFWIFRLTEKVLLRFESGNGHATMQRSSSLFYQGALTYRDYSNVRAGFQVVKVKYRIRDHEIMRGNLV